MQARKHYSRAPITEALIDIQVQLRQEVKLDILAQVYSSIQTEYPKCEEMFVFQGQMIAGASVGATAALVVNFREIYSLSYEYILKHSTDIDCRWRLKSPYLEHFSQAFARLFMQVGLPSSIPRF